MKKLSLHISLFYFIFALFFLAGCGIDGPKTPSASSPLLEKAYTGIKPNNATYSKLAIPCENSEIVELEDGKFDYGEIVKNEYKQGNIEIGHTSIESDPISRIERDIKGLADNIGACRVYWVVMDKIDMHTKKKSPKVFYGATFFAQANVNTMIGIHPKEPSIEKKKEMDRFYGVEIDALMPNGIAERMGLKEGDVILFINQKRCTYKEYVDSMCGVNSRWNIIRIYRDNEVLDIRN